MAGYSLFGPFALVAQVPDEDAVITFRARRFLDGGALSGPLLLSRYGPPGDRLPRRLARQAQWGAQLSHPAIARVLEVGVLEGELYAVREIAVGIDLRTCLELSKKKKAPPPVPACLAVGAQLARLAREIYELGAGEQLLGLVRPEQVVLGWGGRVRVRATGAVPVIANGKSRDPFLAPELSRGAKPSLSTDTWTVARLLRAALAVDPAGRDTPKVSAAYRDSLGPLLTSSLARKPQERMLMPALEERLSLILADTGDHPRGAVAAWLREMSKPPPDIDHTVIDAELLQAGESIYAHADLPLLHFPSDDPSTFESSSGPPLVDAVMPDDDEPKTNLALNARAVDLPSSVFGRILEGGQLDDEPSQESPPRDRSEPDLDAIALSSLDNQEPPADPTTPGVPPPVASSARSKKPRDTAVNDMSDLDVEVDVIGPQGTDVMRAPPEAVVRSLQQPDDDGSGVFAGDPDLAEMFDDDEGDGTRTDPTPSSDRPSGSREDGRVSAIFTQSTHTPEDLISDAKRRLSRSNPALSAGTRKIPRPSREELWSDMATDAGRRPIDGPARPADPGDVFQQSDVGSATDAPLPEEDPDKTAYIDRPAPKTGDSGKSAAATNAAARAGRSSLPPGTPEIDDDPDRTAFLDRPAQSGGRPDDGAREVEQDPDKTAYIDKPKRIVSDDDDEPTDFVISAPPPDPKEDNWGDDEATARLSADVARAIAAGIDKRSKNPAAAQAPPAARDATPSAWGDPLKTGRKKLPEPNVNETALLAVHDVSELLGASNAPASMLQGADDAPLSIADVLPEDPELGMLVVDVPDEAVVFVNGQEHGRGRTVLNDIDRFVSYVVRVHHKGHSPWTGTVTLRGMRAARIEPELQARR